MEFASKSLGARSGVRVRPASLAARAGSVDALAGRPRRRAVPLAFASRERPTSAAGEGGVVAGVTSSSSTAPVGVPRKRTEADKAAILAEAESVLHAALQGTGPQELAEALSSATRRIRRVPKSKTREFCRGSEAVQGAWEACLNACQDMNVHSLDKLLQSLAYSKTIRCLPSKHDEILERVEDTLIAGDMLMNSAPSVATSLLGSFARLEHSMSMELQEQYCQYLSIKVGQFEVTDLARALSHLNKLPRFSGLKKYTLALCSAHISKNAEGLTANQISECMVAFAFSSFQPALKDLKIMEEQFTESFFTVNLQQAAESSLKSTYDVRALMRLLKSYAKLRVQLPVFIVDGLSELLGTSEMAHELLKPKEAANLIWYFAKMNQYPGGALLDAACCCLVEFFGSDAHGQAGSNYVHVQHMPRISWGLAKLRHKPPQGMMLQLDAFAARHVKKMTDSEVTQLIYGHALLDEPMCERSLRTFCKFLRARCDHVDSRPEEALSLRNLSVLLWSLTVLRVWDHGMAEELDSFWECLGHQEGQLGYLNVRGKHALHVAATCGLRETGETLQRVPEQFRTGTFDGMEALAREDKPASEIQREISQVLDSLQVEYFDHRGRGAGLGGGEEGKMGGDELLSADFYLAGGAGGDGGVCMEVDGPSHFFLNTLEPTGKTLFRNRVHRSKGWEVVCLPHFEWEQLVDEESKKAYLVDMLGVTPPPAEREE